MDEYFYSLTSLRDIILLAAVVGLALDIYGSRRLKILGDRLTSIGKEERDYLLALSNYRLEVARWEARCEDIRQAFLSSFQHENPTIWAEKRELDTFIAEVGPRAKSLEQADFVYYSEPPFPELFAKENRLREINEIIGYPALPHPPIAPSKGRLRKLERYISATILTIAFAAVVVVMARIPKDQWDAWRESFLGMLVITMCEVLTPIIVIYPIVRIAIAFSEVLAHLVGVAALWLSMQIARLAQSKGLIWTLRVLAAADISWSVGSRLLRT